MDNNGTVENILNERQGTHGDFSQVGVVAQTLKKIMRQTPNWDKLNPAQKEALEMDAGKTARILCGSHTTCDHWDDKAGYAKLGSRACAAAETPAAPHPRKELEDRTARSLPDLTPAIDEALRATKPAVPYTLPSATKFKTNTEPRPGHTPIEDRDKPKT